MKSGLRNLRKNELNWTGGSDGRKKVNQNPHWLSKKIPAAMGVKTTSGSANVNRCAVWGGGEILKDRVSMLGKTRNSGKRVSSSGGAKVIRFSREGGGPIN